MKQRPTGRPSSEKIIRDIKRNTRLWLRDNTRPLPFANLEFPKGTRKRHGISMSTI